MRITRLEVRRFRSVRSSGLTDCGGLNVLVGKNNAGKSNLLTAIERVIGHLAHGTVADFWPVNRPVDEFTDRECSRGLQIGIEFCLDPTTNAELRKRLSNDNSHLQKAIDQLQEYETFAFILAGRISTTGQLFKYVEVMGAGRLVADQDSIGFEGVRLLGVSEQAGNELFEIHREVSILSNEVQTLTSLREDRRILEAMAEEEGPKNWLTYELRRRLYSPQLIREVESVVSSLRSVTDVSSALLQLINARREVVNSTLAKETATPFAAFAGDTRICPSYVPWILKTFGALDLVQLREDKQKIGRDEAEIFVKMKVRRGGPEQLGSIQQIIKELLGVHVDAFQPDERERGAEMDVNHFLVEANGSGIREALRIILDLELKHPDLALIEEPEVHLHPGLERVLAGYLRQKSRAVQMFVTTHSTEFVDSISFQNAYLVSRSDADYTETQMISAHDATRIPAELGLRLSSLFMFDRLVFVEGPTDESVLRVLAQKLEIDMTDSNVGFVHMKGVRNFAHYAAEATLDLLSRRQIQIWFVTDRDEKDVADVKRMLERMEGKAQLRVLERRELENYLFDHAAIAAFLQYKRKGRKLEDREVAQALQEAIQSMKPEVVRLRVEREALQPVFLNTRQHSGSIEERFEGAVADLAARKAALEQLREQVTQQVEREWTTKSAYLAPGSKVLEQVLGKLGASFDKNGGDAELLASFMSKQGIPDELVALLREVTRKKSKAASAVR